jgi:hypothetical protein
MLKVFDFYVYVYCRPNGVPCYVGKGRRRRWLTHIRKTHNPHLAHIIANAGGDLPKMKVAEGLSDQEACELEIALIKAIGREIHGGPLVNQTDGGDGMSGWTPSKETLAKRSKKLKGIIKGPEWRAALSTSLTGIKRSNETKALIAKIRTGTKASAETKALLSKIKKGVPKPPRSETHCEALSAAAQLRMQAPEERARMKAIRADQIFSEATREKLRNSQRLRRQRERQELQQQGDQP